MRTMEALEARALLASTFTFTDVDSDRVTVKVSGPGEAALTLSNGGDGFISLLTLTGTDAKSTLTISVKKQGAGDGRVDLNNMTSAVLGKLNAPTTDIFEADFNLDEITQFKVGDIDHSSIDLDPPDGKALAIEAASIRLNCDLLFDGDVKTFKLGSATAADFITITGRLASLTVQTGLSGFWEAANYGSVTLLAGVMTAKMRNVTPDAKGYAFGAVKAPTVIAAELEPKAGTGVAGRIKSLTIGVWTGGEIRATGIDTLKVNGDFEPTVVDLSLTPLGQLSLGTATIGGLAETLFQLAGPARSIKIATSGDDLVFDQIGTQAHVGSLTFFGNGAVRGTYEFATMGTLTTGTSTGGAWSFTDLDGNGLSVGRIRASSMNGFQLGNGTPGGIGSLTTTGIEDSEITCAFINTLTVKDGEAGGTLLDSDMFLEGSNASGFALGRVTVANAIEDSRVFASGNIDRLTAGFVRESWITVGALGKVSFENFVGFDPAGFINRFNVVGKVEVGFKGFESSVVQAGTIKSILIASPIELDNADLLFGFGARTFGTITLKNALGQTVKPVTPTVVGDTDPFGVAGSDFVLRVYA